MPGWIVTEDDRILPTDSPAPTVKAKNVVVGTHDAESVINGTHVKLQFPPHAEQKARGSLLFRAGLIPLEPNEAIVLNELNC